MCESAFTSLVARARNGSRVLCGGRGIANNFREPESFKYIIPQLDFYRMDKKRGPTKNKFASQSTTLLKSLCQFPRPFLKSIFMSRAYQFEDFFVKPTVFPAV